MGKGFQSVPATSACGLMTYSQDAPNPITSLPDLSLSFLQRAFERDEDKPNKIVLSPLNNQQEVFM